MAIAKKGLRKITLDEHVYGWKISREDDWDFCLIVTPMENRSPVLSAWITHHKFFGHTKVKPEHPVISPSFIKRLVDRAVENGWKPFDNLRKDVALRVSLIENEWVIESTE